jgi:hypothetical protein
VSLFAEEAYLKAGQKLGNFSRAIVHAALSAPLSIKIALQETSYFLLRGFIACRLLSVMQKFLAVNNAHE